MMQGMMFLPDGRVLIMDKEQYKKVIEQSIVLDLVDNEIDMPNQQLEVLESSTADDREEEKVSGHRQSKESNRKQSQASQKRKVPDESHSDILMTPNTAATVNEQEDRGIRLLSVNPEQRDYLPILNQREFSDITLMVEGKPIYCHQVILASRSTYFEA